MNKKKIVAVLVAGALAIGIIGGSLAWFTANDTVTNPFSTAKGDNPKDPDSGVKILEPNFKPENSKNIVPGGSATKDVSVKNTASYNSFIRVKFENQFGIRDKDGKLAVKTDVDGHSIDAKKINLIFSNAYDKNKALNEGTWVDGGDGWYYFIQKVESDKETSKIIEAAGIDGSCDNYYKNLDFDVKIVAESIQASHDAVMGWAPNDIANVLQKLQDNN